MATGTNVPPSPPRYTDLDPIVQVLLELRVLSMLYAQVNGIQDQLENLRATAYGDLVTTPTLTATP